jgi:Bacterial PH domain
MRQVFSIIPASNGPLWLLVPLSVLLLGLLGLFAYLAYSSRNVQFEVSAEGLRIKGDIYGRTIPLHSLIPQEVKILDLRQDKAYQLTWRTNGIGLPGHKAGWFKLRNGGTGLAFVTDPTRVAYLPTRERYAVLLSVAQPEEFLEALRRVTQGK